MRALRHARTGAAALLLTGGDAGNADGGVSPGVGAGLARLGVPSRSPPPPCGKRALVTGVSVGSMVVAGCVLAGGGVVVTLFSVRLVTTVPTGGISCPRRLHSRKNSSNSSWYMLADSPMMAPLNTDAVRWRRRDHVVIEKRCHCCPVPSVAAAIGE